MAAGKFTVINVAMAKILNGAIVFGSDDLNVCLCDSDESMSTLFVGASGNGLYSDLANEVTGTGYTAGGKALENVTITTVSGVVTISADTLVWPAVTITPKYAVCYKATGDKDILGFFDVETTEPNGRPVIASDLSLLWPQGILKSQRA